LVRIEDVRALLGAEFHRVVFIDVVVPALSGAPSAARLVFMPVQKGPGQHRVFACPKCFHPFRVLFTDGTGGFGCGRCVKKLTRHQREGSYVAWELERSRELTRPRSPELTPRATSSPAA
jgi:hypothetical protein